MRGAWHIGVARIQGHLQISSRGTLPAGIAVAWRPVQINVDVHLCVSQQALAAGISSASRYSAGAPGCV